MIARLIAWSARNLLLVLFGAGFAAAAGVYALMSLTRPTWIRQRVQGQNVSKPLDPALTRRWITPALADRGVRRDTANFLRAVDANELLEVSTRLRRFTEPVVLLWGDSDPFFRSTSRSG